MHAITVPNPGGTDSLVFAELPDPTAGHGEVLIEVAAAGVNRADIGQREGHYPSPTGASPGNARSTRARCPPYRVHRACSALLPVLDTKANAPKPCGRSPGPPKGPRSGPARRCPASTRSA